MYVYLYLYLQCVLFSYICFVALRYRHKCTSPIYSTETFQLETASNTRGAHYARLPFPSDPRPVLTHAIHCIILDWHYFWGHSGEMPALNTTKLVSFLSQFSFCCCCWSTYFLLRCVANFRCLMCLTLPKAYPSVNALLVTVTYTHGCPCACLCRLPVSECVCVCMCV